MGIRFKLTANIEPLQRLRGELRQLKRRSNDTLRQVVRDIHDPALNELQTVPKRRPVRASEYVSAKQRRYVYGFVLKRDAQGNILPYERTGKTAGGWDLQFVSTPDGGTLVFSNPQRAARFVGGSLAVNRKAALRFQQPFHATTGWQPYTDTVQFWIDAAKELYYERMLAGLRGTQPLSGRAYTQPIPRRRR